MGFLSGIGRGLTSLGGDMQKNRLEREDREQRLTEREEIRDYNKGLVADQENRRIAALAETRAYDTGVREATRTYNEGVRADAATAAETAATLADTRAVARAATSAGVARDVVGAREARTDKQWDAAAVGMSNLQNRGKDHPSLVALPGTEFNPASTPSEDWMSMNRVGVTSIPGGADRASATEWASVLRNVTNEGYLYDPTGEFVIGNKFTPEELYNRTQKIIAGQSPGDWDRSVPEPAFEPELIKTPGFGGWVQRTLPWGQTGAEMSTPPVAADVGAPQGIQEPSPRLDQLLARPRTRLTVPDLIDQPFGGGAGSTGQLDTPPGIDPDMYRRMLDSGATPATIQQWIARQAGRGGR